MVIQDKAKKFPLSSGVYRWLDSKGKILYIGRATSLRRRVLQYFRPDLDPRIAEMVSLARDIKFEKTDSLLEAIILEANLIKKFKPKYNIKDRDDRSFSYVVFPSGEFSHPLIVRGRELKKFPASRAKIFGPFMNAGLIRNLLKILRRIFPYSTCRIYSGRPCFDYQIGLCPGACVGEISAKNYEKNIKALIQIFEGKKKALMKALVKSNPELVGALKHLNDAILITNDELGLVPSVSRIEAYDISHFAGQETVGAMTVMINGEPDKAEYRLFNIKTAKAGDDLAALTEVLDRRLNHGDWPLPDIFLIDGGRPQVAAINKLFVARNVSRPLIGLSKFGGDELVFASGTGKNVKDLALSIKSKLQLIRDEAHRFGNSARKRKLSRKVTGGKKLY